MKHFVISCIAVMVICFVIAPPSNAQNEIYACVVEKSGRARIVAAPGQCHPSETLITWNIKGEPGPPGPQGPEGPPGPAGGGVCQDDRVIVEEDCVVTSIAPNGYDLEACSAACPTGTVMVGGGCFVAPFGSNMLVLIRNQPDTGPGSAEGTWECGVINVGAAASAPASMEAKAICLVVADCPE